MEFYRRNKYPLIMDVVWEETPAEGQNIEVDYGGETNKNVWWIGGKFVNRYGFELHNILGWRPV